VAAKKKALVKKKAGAAAKKRAAPVTSTVVEKVDKEVAAIRDIVAEDFGLELITTLESTRKKGPLTGLSWGSPHVNYVCTQNPFVGLTGGRIFEIFGQESSGKTTMCLHAAAITQKMGIPVAYIDMEHAVDLRYAQALGVDNHNLLFSQPDFGEQAMDIAIKFVNAGVGLIIIDSVAALVPLAEIEASMEKALMGAQARMMGKALRKLTPIVGKSQCNIVFINQCAKRSGLFSGLRI